MKEAEPVQIIAYNPATGRKWRIRPYSNGLCYVIEKSPLGTVNPKNGQKIKSEYVSCEKYPVTLDRAISLMQQLMLTDTADQTSATANAVDMELSTSVLQMLQSWQKQIEVEVSAWRRSNRK